MLDQLFSLTARKSTVAREARGAAATFLAMSYILFVNASILQAAGIPFDAAVAATAASAALASILMGIVGNFPVALAAGMGLNSLVAFQLTPALGSWQKAMALVFIDGLVVLALVLFGVRESVMKAIPLSLRHAIGAGIGLFIAFIGLVNAGIVVVPNGTIQTLLHNPNATMPPVTAGSFREAPVIVAALGLIVTAVLLVKKVRGALLLGILFSSLVSIPLGLTRTSGVIGRPDFSTFFALDFTGLFSLTVVPLLLALVLVDFFDTLGTVSALAHQAKLEDPQGRIPGLRRLLAVDAVGAAIGGLFGASSVTCYIESAAGIQEGARTGLHSVFVGLLFAACILLSPLAGFVPSVATSPALILVGFFMVSSLTQIDFTELETGIPAFLCFTTIPLTYSISHGIGIGLISYASIEILRGKFRRVSPVLYFACAAFLVHFWKS